MKHLKKLLQAFLVKVYGLSEDEAADLLNKSEDGTVSEDYIAKDLGEKLLELDKTRVAKLKGKEGEENENFKQGYNKAKKEVLKKFEDDLRAEYGDVDEDGNLKGTELVKAIVTLKAKPTAANAKDISEDVVKAHPAYITLEKANKKAISDADKRVTEEVQKVKDEYAKAETLGKVKQNVLTTFLGLKPVLSQDASKAKSQQDLFVNLFDQFDYEPQADGTYLVMEGTGDQRKRKEDGHGNPIKLQDLVKQEAGKYYDFAVQDPKGSGGNGGAGAGGDGGAGGGGTEYQFKMPKNIDEYNNAIFNAKDAGERAAIKTAWDESNKGATE